MRRSQKVADVFPKHLFWDMDINKLDFQSDKDIVIPRALFATTQSTFQEDIKKLEDIYSKEQIINKLQSTKERISNQVCSLVAQCYHIPVFSRFYK